MLNLPGSSNQKQLVAEFRQRLDTTTQAASADKSALPYHTEQEQQSTSKQFVL